MSQRSLQLNPLNRPATWEQIRDQRNALRESPITLNDGRTFDADQDSFVLFEDSISEFDSLPASALDGNGHLLWKMSNNQYTPCSKADLIAIKAELKTKRAIRAALLQVKAEILTVTSATLDSIQNPSTWGI